MNGHNKRVKSTRLCDLPDEVLEHILSFLTIEDLIRVGCVSKRYRKLEPSTLSLILDESSTCDSRKEQLCSLEKILLRRGCNELQCFQLSWSYCYHYYGGQGHPEEYCYCPEDLNLWMVKFIDNVVSCNVEELHLKLPGVKFPMLHCKSLRHLSINGMFTTIDTPLFGSTCFSNLERLELTQVFIQDVGVFEWISNSCQCIKELQLEDVCLPDHNNATIEIASLKSFTFVMNKDHTSFFYDIDYELRSYFVTRYGLIIKCEKLEDVSILIGEPCYTGRYEGALYFSAPNHKHMKWSGHVMKFQNLSEVMSLENAEIELHPGVTDFDNVFHLLHGIRSAKVMELSEMTMMCLYKGRHIERELPQLDDVCCLRIHGLSLMDDHVPAMLFLFKGMRNLAALHIHAGRYGSKYRSKSYYSHESFSMYGEELAFIDISLKEVTIELSGGCNGINFTRYIMDHALQLEKMVVYCLPEQAYEVRRFKWNSNAEMVFRLREDTYESIDDVYDYLDRDIDPSEEHLIEMFCPLYLQKGNLGISTTRKLDISHP